MIHIKRDCLDTNGNLIKPSNNWFIMASEETKKAILEKENHNPDAKIYGHVVVRRALLELFHDKCAYCESKIAGIFDWEVEHFRPKGRVAERKEHPGYYWLAYEWENLYPGCQFCNQRRRDHGTWDNPQEGISAGKLDQFPLSDETMRAMDHTQNIAREEPVRLLLDPCNDDPESELTFDIIGRAQPINSGKRATNTIYILHLNRSDLAKSRRRHVEFLRRLIDDILHEVPENKRRKTQNKILKKFAQDDCCYAGLVRSILRDPVAFGF